MTILKKIIIFVPLYVVWVVLASRLPAGKLCPVCGTSAGFEFVAITGYLIAIMIPIGLFLWWLKAVPGWIKKVEAEGQPAPATILSVKNTGMVINNTVAVIKLQLRVEPPHAAPFEVSQEKEISMIMGLGRYVAGAHVKVKYDPANLKHVVIVSEADTPAVDRAAPRRAAAAASSSRSDVTEKLAELSRLHKSGELTEAEYTAAKKKLLG